jgi:hypothetical protein
MEDILSWETLVFSLAIFVFSLFLRRALEAVFPTLARNTPLSTAQRVWEMVILPIVPVLVGILIALFVKTWPYPPGLTATGPRVLYGAICGFFSTWAYRVISALITQKFQVTVEDPLKENNPKEG